MRLTKHTDYALRVLLYLASFPDRWSSTEEISQTYDISNHHLVKVVNHLGKLGYVEVKRGRQGGIRLAKAPEDMNVGALVRATENDFHIVECFDAETNTCGITRVCTLIRPLAEARDAFLDVLDGYTLADLVGPKVRPKMKSVFLQLAG